jgi:hypothetical protein
VSLALQLKDEAFLEVKIDEHGDGIRDGMRHDGVEPKPVEQEEKGVVYPCGNDGGGEEFSLGEGCGLLIFHKTHLEIG